MKNRSKNWSAANRVAMLLTLHIHDIDEESCHMTVTVALNGCQLASLGILKYHIVACRVCQDIFPAIPSQTLLQVSDGSVENRDIVMCYEDVWIALYLLKNWLRLHQRSRRPLECLEGRLGYGSPNWLLHISHFLFVLVNRARHIHLMC